LTLTALYVVILATILIASSGISRFLFSQRLDDRFHPYEEFSQAQQGRMPPPPNPDDVRADLFHVTILVDSALLIVAGGLSYWLAGLTLRPIRAAYMKQRQFLSDASHELRTPLAILRTQMENERATTTSPASRAALDSNLEEIGRMTRLVGDLLTLSRLGAGPSACVSERPVDVVAAVLESVERLRPIADKRRVVLSFADNGSARLFALAPGEDLLVQAFTNVIHNAVLYNKENGRVDVAVSSEDGQIVVTVTDTGVGIAEEELKRVFDRFYRSEKSRSRQTGGSGLGLSIVQSILTFLNGSVSMTSHPETGTVVVMKLPIHKAS